MKANRDVIKDFIAGRNSKNRNLTSRDGELYTYAMRLGWQGSGITTVRDAPSITSMRHLGDLVHELYQAGLQPVYFDDKCVWASGVKEQHPVAYVDGIEVVHRRSPRVSYETVIIGTDPAIWCPGLVKHFYDQPVLEKKVRAQIKRRETEFDTDRKYSAIIAMPAYEQLKKLPCGCYGDVIIAGNERYPYGRTAEYNGLKIDFSWSRGINQKTVKEAERFINSMPPRLLVILALGGP